MEKCPWCGGEFVIEEWEAAEREETPLFRYRHSCAVGEIKTNWFISEDFARRALKTRKGENKE